MVDDRGAKTFVSMRDLRTTEMATAAPVYAANDARAAPLRLLRANASRSEEPCPPALGGPGKRAFDFVAALALIVMLAPVLLIVALLVRLDSPGPALFTQRRGGYRGASFLIYKFRTMTTCEDGAEIPQAVRHDARVTRLGALLRRTSVDELPQLINVVLGEMSLIGPRPHAVAHDRAFAAIEPSYQRRSIARPGITGLAQVSGARGATSSHEAVRARVHFDLAYIAKWSPLLDASILVRTVLLVFRDKNAF